MQIPLQITFRDMEPSDAIEQAVREKAEKLEQFAEIMSCRVVVQMINKHSHKGTLYQVSIELTATGREVWEALMERQVQLSEEFTAGADISRDDLEALAERLRSLRRNAA